MVTECAVSFERVCAGSLYLVAAFPESVVSTES